MAKKKPSIGYLLELDGRQVKPTSGKSYVFTLKQLQSYMNTKLVDKRLSDKTFGVIKIMTVEE